jgi:hypothetical protein
MKIRASLIAAAGLAALAGTAQAQSTTAATVAYQLTWGDTGDNDGVVEPGESARVRMTVAFTPPSGTVIPYTPSGGGSGTGTLMGFGSAFVDFNLGNANGGTLTTTGSTGGINNGRAGAWAVVPGGNGTVVGDTIINVQPAQFPFNSDPFDPDNNTTGVRTTNPISNIYTFVWTPASYATRTVNVGMAPSLASQGNAATVMLRVNPDTSIPPTAVAALFNFGALQIPVVPAPSSLALLGLGGLIAGRRRR